MKRLILLLFATLCVYHLQAQTVIHDTICDGDSYSFHDTTLTLPGTHHLTFDGENYTIVLTVLPTQQGIVRDTIVENQLPWDYHGNIFNNAVTHQTIRYSNDTGCDSIVDYNLFVWQNQTSSVHIRICLNQYPYHWGELVFTEPGIQEWVINGSHGEDSVIKVDVSTLPAPHRELERGMCDGSSFSFMGNIYTDTGTYSIVVPMTQGCDSVITLHLVEQNDYHAVMSINPPYATPDAVTLQLEDRSPQAYRHTWVMPDGIYNDSAFSYRYPTSHDSIYITLISVSTIGCRDTISQYLHYRHPNIWAPNAFTPDELSNQTFSIYGTDVKNVKVYIYTIHGQLIAAWDGLDGTWDGTFNGNPLPQGIYTYFITYQTLIEPQKQQRQAGTVSLLR